MPRGSRPSATRPDRFLETQYRVCVQSLAEGLRIAPQPETTALYEGLVGRSS